MRYFSADAAGKGSCAAADAAVGGLACAVRVGRSSEPVWPQPARLHTLLPMTMALIKICLKLNIVKL